MVLIQAHKHEAFSELVTRHTDRFYALSYRTLFNQSDAEDIVQESFLKLWHKPTLWQPKRGSIFTTWFYRLIINACYDSNKKKSSQEISFSDEKNGQNYELVAEDEESSQQTTDIEAALKELPERQRMALNLCFYEELSNSEAASIMGIRLKALQSLIMRGKANLKAYFNTSGDNNHEHK
jgi:RNA polymerase sigma-70 factor (ECF subfamily)